MDLQVGSAPDGYSQATERTARDFRDPHGRYWNTVIEKKTGAPCGPLSLKVEAPMVGLPPILPAEKYMRFNVARGTMLIDYDQWIEDAQRAKEEYDGFALEQANLMYGTKGPQAIEEQDPALFRRIGQPPPAVEQIMAAKEGNAWVLGFDSEKPDWAKEVFPETKAPRVTSFPSASEERAKRFPNASDETVTYPKHEGGGRRKLSNGTHTPGKTKREDAEAAEAALFATV